MENKTAFVLLAGGKSERMGHPKGLLNYNKNFWILEQLKRISKTSISTVFIGLGFQSDAYFKAIPWLRKAQENFIFYQNLKIKVVVNKTPEIGPFSTLQAVLKEINKEPAVLVNHIDIPLLNIGELQTIINSENEITFPNYNGKNGHPIKLNYSFWKTIEHIDLLSTEARLDFQLKKINPAKISTIEVSDRAILYNLNTPSDWNMYLNESI